LSREVAVVATLAVERVQRPLHEAGRNACPHVCRSIEQFCGNARGVAADLVVTGFEPIEPRIDRHRIIAREVAHLAEIAVAARDIVGDAKAGGSTAVARVVHITSLALDKVFDQSVDGHKWSPVESR